MSNVKRPPPEFSGVILKGHKAIPRYLFTANQMEAYANERVREALEEAAQEANDWAMQYVEVDSSPHRVGDYIRALITKE